MYLLVNTLNFLLEIFFKLYIGRAFFKLITIVAKIFNLLLKVITLSIEGVTFLSKSLKCRVTINVKRSKLLKLAYLRGKVVDFSKLLLIDSASYRVY